ncbi:hypothetical protein K461DRAFT_93820 [Myriangium duriaei CBS 260.36]|uniref:Uncharacterized protein n=1 Tax=Myriangium duriaei CBS 260.36 TaxID=1168546 RepID=A0A9P4MKG0_9PEZI|nr:hypothetical protein K461DRAFT_93820 [Myriangium duriaei CBS 260.36]
MPSRQKTKGVRLRKRNPLDCGIPIVDIKLSHFESCPHCFFRPASLLPYSPQAGFLSQLACHGARCVRIGDTSTTSHVSRLIPVRKGFVRILAARAQTPAHLNSRNLDYALTQPPSSASQVHFHPRFRPHDALRVRMITRPRRPLPQRGYQ